MLDDRAITRVINLAIRERDAILAALEADKQSAETQKRIGEWDSGYIEGFSPAGKTSQLLDELRPRLGNGAFKSAYQQANADVIDAGLGAHLLPKLEAAFHAHIALLYDAQNAYRTSSTQLTSLEAHGRTICALIDVVQLYKPARQESDVINESTHGASAKGAERDQVIPLLSGSVPALKGLRSDEPDRVAGTERDLAAHAVPALPALDSCLHAIHYSQGLQANCPAETPPISAIVVQHVLTGQQQTFAALHIAEQRHISPTDFLSQMPQLEKRLLRDFFDFVTKTPGAVWLHWAMRQPRFGFEVLAQRARLHRLTPADIPLQRRFDLSGYLKRRFGEDYVPHPRLWNALEQNGLLGPDLLTERAADAAWASGEYARLIVSLSRKVDGIADLFERVRQGRFQTADKSLDESISNLGEEESPTRQRAPDESRKSDEAARKGQITEFSGGEMVFYADRVELCGITICGGPLCEQARKTFDLLRQKNSQGEFVAIGSRELAEKIGRKGGPDSVPGFVRDLRTRICQELLRLNIDCGRFDVIGHSKTHGYQLMDWLSVHDGNAPNHGSGQDHDVQTGGDDDPNRDDPNDPDEPNKDDPDDPDGEEDTRCNWILTELKKGRGLHTSDVERELRCSRTTAKRVLTALKREGRIEFIGPRRSGHYRLKKGTKPR